MIQSSVILLIALCTAAIFRRQSASVRHIILSAGLAGALLVPFCPSGKFQVRPVNYLFPEQEPLEGKQVIRRSDLEFLASTGPSLQDIAIRIWLGGGAISALVLLAGIARIGWIVLRAEPLTSGRRYSITFLSK